MAKQQIVENVKMLGEVAKVMSEMEYRIKRIAEKMVKSKEVKIYIEDIEKIESELLFDCSNLRVDVENLENILEE